MSNWTQAKEARYDDLTRQLEELRAERGIAFDGLVNLLTRTLPSHTADGVGAQVIAAALIANADTLRDALAPFDSGVRAGLPPAVRDAAVLDIRE